MAGPSRKTRLAVGKGIPNKVASAWMMRGRLLDLNPNQLDSIASDIAAIPKSKWPEWLERADTQINAKGKR